MHGVWALLAIVPAFAGFGLMIPVASAASGALDPAFGTGGIVTTAFQSGDDRAAAVAPQPDGKLIVAGTSLDADGIGSFAVARYDAAGGLDPTFGVGGKVTTRIGVESRANAVLLQADGKIVVAGASGDFQSDDIVTAFALARYEADGTLDQTFGTGGTVVTPVGSSSAANALLALPGGRLLAAGGASISFASEVALVAYDASGQVDPTFGVGGKVTTFIGGGGASARTIVRLPDGKLVVGGNASNSSVAPPCFALVRYEADGTLDTTFDGNQGRFGDDGTVVTCFNSTAFAGDLVVQPDGKPVLAGYAIGDGFDFAVVRYNTDGTLDPTFGSRGIALTTIGAGTHELADALVLQGDGRLVAAGRAVTEANSDFLMVRYEADGTIDASFGTGGKVVTPVGDGNDEIHALALLSDGSLLAAGQASNGEDDDFALARYLNAAGTTTTVPAATTTTTSSTTTTPASTTSTTSTLPCLTVRCIADAALAGAACEGVKIPASVGKQVSKATTAASQAAVTSERKARALRRRAKAALNAARKAATKAARGRSPKIPATCAAAIAEAMTRAAGTL